MADLSNVNDSEPVEPTDRRVHDSNYVLNELKRLQIYSQGTLTTHFTDEGFAYTISARYNEVGNGESVYLYIENPDDSGYDYDIIFTPRSNGLSLVNISFDATQNDGTAVTANNLKSGSDNTFSGIVESSTTGDEGTRPVAGTTFIEDLLPGGTQGTRVGASAVGGIGYTIDEGDNKLIEVTNEGNASYIALNVILLEDNGEVKFSTNL